MYICLFRIIDNQLYHWDVLVTKVNIFLKCTINIHILLSNT